MQNTPGKLLPLAEKWRVLLSNIQTLITDAMQTKKPLNHQASFEFYKESVVKPSVDVNGLIFNFFGKEIIPAAGQN